MLAAEECICFDCAACLRWLLLLTAAGLTLPLLPATPSPLPTTTVRTTGSTVKRCLAQYRDKQCPAAHAQAHAQAA